VHAPTAHPCTLLTVACALCVAAAMDAERIDDFEHRVDERMDAFEHSFTSLRTELSAFMHAHAPGTALKRSAAARAASKQQAGGPPPLPGAAAFVARRAAGGGASPPAPPPTRPAAPSRAEAAPQGGECADVSSPLSMLRFVSR
jgi:hypothetical protein